MFNVVSGLPILAFNYPKQHLKAMLSGFLFYINSSKKKSFTATAIDSQDILATSIG